MAICLRRPRRLATAGLIALGILALGILLTTSPTEADAGNVRGAPPTGVSPTEALRRHFDEVLVTAQAPNFVALETERRQAAIRRISGRMFDWGEMARRALGPHWRERTVAERHAFTDQFSRLAERAYMWQIEQLRDRPALQEPVRYLRQTTNGREAVVHTEFAHLRDLPIAFVMARRADRWQVCDVLVDGVSAAANYRTQFERVIARSSYAGLMDRMVAKIEETAGRTTRLAALP